MYFSAYYADPTTQALTAAILNAAADEDMKIDGNTFAKWTNHVIVTLSIKNAQRIEIWLGMTKQEFFLALSNRQTCFYPYKPASEDDIQNGTDVQFDQNVAYRYVLADSDFHGHRPAVLSNQHLSWDLMSAH